MSASPILITGGAQRLGRHCAERLVQDGQPVIISYRCERPELEAMRERGIVTLQADFSSEDGILDFLERLKDETDALRAIVHNASDWAPDSDGEDAGAAFEPSAARAPSANAPSRARRKASTSLRRVSGRTKSGFASMCPISRSL